MTFDDAVVPGFEGVAFVAVAGVNANSRQKGKQTGKRNNGSH